MEGAVAANIASYKMPSEHYCRIPTKGLQIIRQSILLDQHNQPIPMSQAMPKYIPKEPVKACVSSPLGRLLSSSRNGSVLFSEVESDNCSTHTHNSIAPAANYITAANETGDKPSQDRHTSRHRLRKSRHRTKNRTDSITNIKARPVNVVGPIISHTEDREEIFSASGAESLESEGDHQRLHEELIAQRKLISKLEEDLKSQLKVNAELKKLLVASVGNDLEYRVEKLAQDKVQLSATVGTYSEKLYKDLEDLDRISIQADMWRSKYLASRLQAEELSCSGQTITRKYTDAMAALQHMLGERHTINTNLSEACSALSDNSSQHIHQNTHRSTYQLSSDILSLATTIVKVENPTDISSLGSTVDAACTDSQVLSQSETAAYNVLSDQMVPVLQLEVPHNEEIPRYSSLLCQSKASTRSSKKPLIITV